MKPLSIYTYSTSDRKIRYNGARIGEKCAQTQEISESRDERDRSPMANRGKVPSSPFFWCSGVYTCWCLIYRDAVHVGAADVTPAIHLSWDIYRLHPCWDIERRFFEAKVTDAFICLRWCWDDLFGNFEGAGTFIYIYRYRGNSFRCERSRCITGQLFWVINTAVSSTNGRDARDTSDNVILFKNPRCNSRLESWIWRNVYLINVQPREIVLYN